MRYMVLSFLRNYQSSFTHSYRPGRGQSFTGSKLYLSMKACCCGCSAAEKNSFISAEHGIIWRAGACTLRWEFEWLGLVVDPGVLIVPWSLIKLQGVVSLVLLVATEHTYTLNFQKQRRRKAEHISIATMVINNKEFPPYEYLGLFCLVLARPSNATICYTFLTKLT